MSYSHPDTLFTKSDSHLSSEPSPPDGSTQVSMHNRASDPVWHHHLSTTFSQLSDQFKEVSKALLTNPPSSEDAMASLLERLANIEEKQKVLEVEIRDLREHISAPKDLRTTETEELLKAHIELYKLDQERLPGRLQNALATKSLSPVNMLPMKNRKFPPNAPTTRGEFEHLTKERYEGLMTCYDIPISGDTAAKRESLRTFLGIPGTPVARK